MIPEQVLEVALKERIIFVMGDKDTGKTTFVLALANELFHQGFSVGIIDADIGQSDIGPPTTVGFGVVQTPLTSLCDAVLQSLYFVGSISPKGCLLPLVIGTRKMLDNALTQELQKIILDTTGLISGQLGRVLKTHKIQLTAPDVIVCLQRAGECEHILSAYHGFEKPIILRLLPPSQCRTKTISDRQSHRTKFFKRYFTEARLIHCSLEDIGVFDTHLFKGSALSEQRIKQLNQELRASIPVQTALPSQANPPTPVFPQILWGEILGREIAIVTSQKLKYQQMMRLKTVLGESSYIKNSTPEDYRNLLLGLLDHNGACCALGILRTLDFAAKQASIFTCASPQEIAAVQFSGYTYEYS
ncbi:GTPase or GTP-binding protein-like protein [Candidatus Vecturithrix granuli]|uniref:GTPase or GTP-binding protein-like protein n=1 Tax=Vecturithrix granuli TaxID=1499967 RepID=A0A0S6W5E3_VECG1|nr:GTPase or GTP-binding protein-like protein [Candidatus Vecturithrix granuli]